MYEESQENLRRNQAENERLKDKLKRSDEQLKEVRSLLEKAQSSQNKVILSEAEKRERRAMERKLSEMEEELKVSLDLVCIFLGVKTIDIYVKGNETIAFTRWIKNNEETEHNYVYDFMCTNTYQYILVRSQF